MKTRTHSRGKRVLALLACAVALVAAGCGSDKQGKQIPQSSVSDLESSLASIQRRYEQGDGACRDITEGNDTDVAAVQAKLDALPKGVDKDVRDALDKSFRNLFDLVRGKCKTKTETNTTPTLTTPTATQPAPTPTQTQTTPTQTTPTQTTTTPQKDKGKGKKDQPKPKTQPKDNKGSTGNDSGGTAAPGTG